MRKRKRTNNSSLSSIIVANWFSILRQSLLISARLLQSAIVCVVAFHVVGPFVQVMTEQLVQTRSSLTEISTYYRGVCDCGSSVRSCSFSRQHQSSCSPHRPTVSDRAECPLVLSRSVGCACPRKEGVDPSFLPNRLNAKAANWTVGSGLKSRRD
jgi:hypothetical protein